MPTREKPKWPHRKETILTPAPNGQWVKKHRGKTYYFGTWDDPDGALVRWRREWPVITAGGEVQRVVASSEAIKSACQAFLNARRSDHEAGDIEWETFREVRGVCKRILKVLGDDRTIATIGPRDFASIMADVSHQSASSRAKMAGIVHRIFEWIAANRGGTFDYGSALKRPPAKAIRRQRNQRDDKTLRPAQIHAMLNVASERNRAILMLGINGGYGNKDVAMLRTADVDLDAAVINHFRNKTEARRVVPLWPETVKALKRCPRDHELMFPDSVGKPLVRRGQHGVCRMMETIRTASGVTATYYGFRYTFATIAAETGDDHARKLIMGHVIDGVSENYVMRFPMDRLLRVSGHVHDWLYSKASG